MRTMTSILLAAAWLGESTAIAAASNLERGLPAPGYSQPQPLQAQAIAAGDSTDVGPGQQTPRPGSPGGNPPGSLSHELSRSRGVIHPPTSPDRNVVTPPHVGTSPMPVIPPPGTPGGNPRVQPK